MLNKPKARNKANLTDSQLADLGRMLVSVYDSGYLDKKQAYKTSFIKGMLSGVGGVIGATLVVTLLVWFLSLFSQVPLLNRVVNLVNNTIESKK